MRSGPILLTQRALLLAFVSTLAVAIACRASNGDRRAPEPQAAAVHAIAENAKDCRERTPASRGGKAAALIAPTTTMHLPHPVRVTPPLGQSGYVFPLPGPYPPFADTFGAPRADTGWHHGDDLFAPRGTPVLAAADSVVFSVGWNRIGGWRLWLRDRTGNLFYYAHLERYTPIAVDGRRVLAGQALGYVGTSGDAVNTPPHLFFEINPAGLRHLGYDGAVDPTNYLRHWAELRAPAPERDDRVQLRARSSCLRGRPRQGRG